MTERSTCRQLLKKYASQDLSLPDLLATAESIDVAGRQLLSAVHATPSELKDRIAELNISQNAYAAKVHMNASTISRAIAGASMPLNVSLEILGLSNEQHTELLSVIEGNASLGSTITAQAAPATTLYGASKMTLKDIDTSDMAAYLTSVQATVGMGAMTGYFMFDAGELHAASYDAYEDDEVRLRTGYRLVEAAAIRTVCDAIEEPGRAISRDLDLFGDLKTLILGFANSVVTMTVPEQNVHLIALFHPKRLYQYGFGLKAQMELLELVRSKPPAFSVDDKRRLRRRSPFDGTVTPDHVNDIALGNLLKGRPDELSGLMTHGHPPGIQERFSEDTPSFSRGFVLLEEGPNKKLAIRSASESLLASGRNDLRYRDEYRTLASRDFTDQVLHALTEGQERLHDAPTVEELTGKLRTFWLSFDKAVIGINPFDDRRGGVKGSQYYLLSVYRADTPAHLRYNYGRAREAIRALCQEADNI